MLFRDTMDIALSKVTGTPAGPWPWDGLPPTEEGAMETGSGEPIARADSLLDLLPATRDW